MSGLSPFAGEDSADTMRNVSRCEWDFNSECFDGISDQAKDFIKKLIVRQPLLVSLNLKAEKYTLNLQIFSDKIFSLWLKINIAFHLICNPSSVLSYQRIPYPNLTHLLLLLPSLSSVSMPQETYHSTRSPGSCLVRKFRTTF